MQSICKKCNITYEVKNGNIPEFECTCGNNKFKEIKE